MSNFMNQIAFKRGWNKVFVRARIRSIIIVLSELEDCLGRLRIKISLDFSLDSTLQSKYALPKNPSKNNGFLKFYVAVLISKNFI